MRKFLILTTSEFNPSDGTYKPVSSKFWADLNERLNYRGSANARDGFHIKNIMPGYFRRPKPTQEQRQLAYEEKCLENGKRPFNYSDQLWEEYLHDVRSEDHTVRCENANAWMYQI